MKYPDKFVVRIDQKFGVINISGDLLIPIEYESIEYDETFEIYWIICSFVRT